MKFRNQARLCLAVTFDFEAHIMLSLYLTFQGTGYRYGEKFNSIMWLRIKISVNIFLVISIDL